MAELKIVKATGLPTTLEANAIYLIKTTGSSEVSMFVTNSVSPLVASPLKTDSSLIDNQTITDAILGTTITPTSDTEYAYTFSSFDLSAPVGTCYVFEMSATIIYQNATSINDFRTVTNVSSNLSGILPLVPTPVNFPNQYFFKVTVIRVSDKWIQSFEIIGGSSNLDSRIRLSSPISTTFTGLVTPKIGLKTPNSAVTSGDQIIFHYINKTRIK